jgi:hypothetical protein
VRPQEPGNPRRPALVPLHAFRDGKAMGADLDYGGECEVIIQATGQSRGRFWIDIEFNGHGILQSVAILSVRKPVGAGLKDAGPLLLTLDDGRQLHATVSLVLATETSVALTGVGDV